MWNSSKLNQLKLLGAININSNQFAEMPNVKEGVAEKSEDFGFRTSSALKS